MPAPPIRRGTKKIGKSFHKKSYLSKRNPKQKGMKTTKRLSNFKAMLFSLFAFVVSTTLTAQSPTITSFSPTTGSVGTLVTITGTNLSSPTTFAIGRKTAIVVSNTGSTLVGMVMPDAVTGIVSVSTTGGTANGSSNWITHEISKLFSQSHSLAFTDMNGDGHPDLVTGKRYLAHQDGHDPGSYEPAVLYWFEHIPGKDPQWIPHQIDDNSGIGNSIIVKDINGDKLPDIIVSNKKGVFFFEQFKQAVK